MKIFVLFCFGVFFVKLLCLKYYILSLLYALIFSVSSLPINLSNKKFLICFAKMPGVMFVYVLTKAILIALETKKHSFFPLSFSLPRTPSFSTAKDRIFKMKKTNYLCVMLRLIKLASSMYSSFCQNDTKDGTIDCVLNEPACRASCYIDIACFKLLIKFKKTYYF